MLLSLMRRHAKSWLIKFLIGIIALVFIFYFGYSFSSRRGVKVAMVNGEPISGLEYQKAYRVLLEALQKDYKSVWSDNLIKVFDLKNRALENLISQKVVSQEAKRIGLDITEKEIQDQILSYPAFQFNGRFDESRYRSLLGQNRMKPEDFEASIEMELLQKKVRQFLMTLLPVTDQETLDHYIFSNQKVKISFVKISPDRFKESISLDNSSMENYFNENKERYRIPEKIKITYITIDPNKFRDKVLISDQLIKSFYEDNIDLFKQEKQVKARHILFKLKRDASEDETNKVREKALSILKRARGGEDFSLLAKQHSEGPTGKQGGDLGYFSKGQMVKPFEEAVFNMKKGQISELVKTSFGFHIIKVEDIKEAGTKGLEEVGEQIKETIIKNTSMDLAHEKALSFIDQMPYEVNLAQYAQQHNVQIKHSDYFSQNEPLSDIGGDRKLWESVFSLQKNDVSELIELGDKFFIIQVADKKPSRLSELKEVSDTVKEDFKAHLAMLKAKSVAEEYLDKLRGGKSWNDLTKENNLTPATTDFFTRRGQIPEIGYVPELQEAVFNLGENRRYPDTVFESEEGVFVIRWEGEEGIDEKKYIQEKERYRYSLLLAKHQGILKNWIENLKKDATIEILNPVSDK